MPTRVLFPTLVHQTKLSRTPARQTKDAFLATLAKEANVFRELDDAGRRWSKTNYPAGYTSYSSVTDLAFRSSNFGFLKDSIDREVAKFARALDMDLGKGRREMSSFWINIMGQGSHHAFHLHPLSAISGTGWPSAMGRVGFERT